MLTATVPAGTVINRVLIISTGHKYDRRKLQIFVIHRVNYFSGSTTPRLNGWFLRTLKQVTLSYSQQYKGPLITFSFSWNVKFNKLFRDSHTGVIIKILQKPLEQFERIFKYHSLDISWPEIESLSFICIFYFRFQLICNFRCEHWQALPKKCEDVKDSSVPRCNTDRL